MCALTRQPVFISLKAPFNGISSQMVAQSLNSSIIESGLNPQEFSAECFRPSAATTAVLSGCDPNTTRVRGRWKTDSAFYGNYVYPISRSNISDKIITSRSNVLM